MGRYIKLIITVMVLMMFIITISTINYQSGWYNLNIKTFILYLCIALIIIAFVDWMDKVHNKKQKDEYRAKKENSN